MPLPAILGIALPLISGIAGLFGQKAEKKESSTTSGVFDSSTAGTQFDLPPELLAQLVSLFGGIVGGGAGETAQAAGVKRLNEISQFDPIDFADKVTKSATSAAGIQLESSTNAADSEAGGRGSSMAALLKNRLRNETAANVGGITAQARATGEQIATGGVAQLMESLTKGITDLVAVTRGAATTGQLAEKGTQSGTSKGTTTASSGGGLGGFFSGLSSGLSSYWGKAQQ